MGKRAAEFFATKQRHEAGEASRFATKREDRGGKQEKRLLVAGCWSMRVFTSNQQLPQAVFTSN
jgi:hypothetical protein